MAQKRLTSFGRTRTILLAAAAWALVSLLAAPGAAAQPGDRRVDCDRGKTIAEVLEQAEDHALTIVVTGTCQENLVISRDRVTLLAAHPGAGVDGPDAQANTITVTGAQVTIDGLTVTGGRNGIAGVEASRLIVRNCSVTGGNSGIVFFRGASGAVDGCTMQGNPRHGIFIEGSAVSVTNSTLTGNGGFGVLLSTGASGRIGLEPTGAFAGNTINGNRSAGIQVTTGSSAVIADNTISGNGFLPNGSAGQLPFGVNVFHSQAQLANNTITGNAGSGVVAGASRLVIGALVGFAPEANTISGNGSVGVPNAQVVATGGASIEVRHAQISGNTPGVALHMRSVMNAFGGSISNTAGNGIELGTGAGASFANPPVRVTATGFGLECFGTEASFADVGPGGTAGLGTISPNCTGF